MHPLFEGPGSLYAATKVSTPFGA